MTHVATKPRRARRIGGALLAALALGVTVSGLGAPVSAFADSTDSPDGSSCALEPACITLHASPTAVDFGRVTVGADSPRRSITLSNVGDAAAHVSVNSASRGFAVDGSGCTARLAPGASCSLVVTFAPASAGPKGGMLTITTDPAGSQTVRLWGSGVEKKGIAGISVTPTALHFGAVAVGRRTAARSVTVKNTGDATDEVNTISATEPFHVDGSGCLTKPLAPGATCTISVTFAPRTGGDASGTLRIATQNGGSATVPLSGSGATAAFAVTPRALSFGEVPVGRRSATKTETVRSTGALTVTVQRVSNPRFTVDARACTGHLLAPGRSCPVRVSFAPVSTGPVTDTLVITTSAGRFAVPLSGTGTKAHYAGGVHTGPHPGRSQPGRTRPRGAHRGLSRTGPPARQALDLGLALLAIGVILQVAGTRRRRT